MSWYLKISVLSLLSALSLWLGGNGSADADAATGCISDLPEYVLASSDEDSGHYVDWNVMELSSAGLQFSMEKLPEAGQRVRNANDGQTCVRSAFMKSGRVVSVGGLMSVASRVSPGLIPFGKNRSSRYLIGLRKIRI